MSSFLFSGTYLRIKSIGGNKSYVFCRKKSIKKAVRRNRLKRIMRDCFYHKPAHKAVNVAVCSDPGTEDGTLLRDEWLRFLCSVKRPS